jgi:hypothetical protein
MDKNKIIKNIIDKGIKKTRDKCLRNVEEQIKQMRKGLYKKYGVKNGQK